jgi:DNA modification methylase
LIIQGDALSNLSELKSESVDCCITSPPYWALRDYKVEGQLGLEPTFQEYVSKLVTIFDQVKRVLKKTGTCWVVMGDTYVGTGDKKGRSGGVALDKKCVCSRTLETYNNKTVKGIPSKSLCMIPSRFAIAMIDQGWILRNDLIWQKGNCMPSSAKDRFTIDYEHVFFFVKGQKYWFETQYESNIKDPEDIVRRALKTSQYNRKASYFGGHYHNNKQTEEEVRKQVSLGRIKRAVWKINTQPYKEAHFAVFPEKLIEPMIRAGCPVDGTVLDCFMGSATTGLVALKNARNFIGIELSADYIKLAQKRLEPYLLQAKLTT